MRACDDDPLPLSSLPSWSEILFEAVAIPGTISTAYNQFWNYSIGNQLLAYMQCFVRGLPIGPLHTFQGWTRLGRRVRKGEKAIALYMPIQVKHRPRKTSLTQEGNATQDADQGESVTDNQAGIPVQDKLVTRFVLKPHWFVLAQTDGRKYKPAYFPNWEETRALSALDIKRVSFEHLNGNVQGYAQERSVAVSPIAAMPHKTLFHEIAHVLLGHTRTPAGLDDHDHTPVNLREVEAECVALICCESLRLPGIEFSRGYIQHWLGHESIPDTSAQKIFKAADAILKAGRTPPPSESDMTVSSDEPNP